MEKYSGPTCCRGGITQSDARPIFSHRFMGPSTFSSLLESTAIYIPVEATAGTIPLWYLENGSLPLWRANTVIATAVNWRAGRVGRLWNVVVASSVRIRFIHLK